VDNALSRPISALFIPATTEDRRKVDECRPSQRRSPVTQIREQAYWSPALDRRTPLSEASQNFRDLPAHGRRAATEGVPDPRARQRGRGRLTNKRRGKRQGGRPGFRSQGSGLSAGCGSSPPPSAATTLDTMPIRKRPVKTAPTPPEQDVRKLQTKLAETDFLRDLDRASTDRSAEKLAAASRRDPASPRT
jgi:hypothetical protein